ncbi:nucleobase:cation symporter-2 family protein [Streptomyces albireticuli]|uniref:nucleobase:cation symporter-2 family protein n=2 Tax=Streptomyces albireticuli TaxID=1940 RepID=UPI001E5772FE|nr:nucleobase:cation symporter-2 family protein [Streptomyces albireticuli]MCD9140707.1 purine permease [Streptomyces albireticuli]MCD9161331.1 purine permease [Streptomyces albireticuli]MCD9190611.1 purine permease [Streptomyces albireticuli]
MAIVPGSTERTPDPAPEHPAPHPVDHVPSVTKLLAGGFQHVAASYAGVVAPPLVVGAAIGLPPKEITFLVGAALFTAGIATLLQTIGFWKVGARLPFVNGVSFAGVAPMLAVADAQADRRDALPVVYGAVIVAGALGFLLAPYFCRLVRFFPPVVSGTVITLIGITLLPVSFGWIQGGRTDRPASLTDLGLAGATLVIVLLLRRLLRGFLQQIAILLGLVVGTLIAVPVGAVDLGPTAHAPLIGFPAPFHFGAPQFAVPAIVSMCVLMLVCMTESTADMLALGEIVGREADEEVIARGLRADTLGSAVGPLFNGFANSAFAQNIGLVALTRVRSRFVVATCGLMFLLLGLSPAFASLIAVVPRPVLGGAGIVLFGTVAASGVNVLLKAGLDKGDNILIAATSLGIGLIPVVSRTFYDNSAIPETLKIILDSGVSAGCLTAVVLNLAFNHLGARRSVRGD